MRITLYMKPVKEVKAVKVVEEMRGKLNDINPFSFLGKSNIQN
jgi:hypothetical protein